VAREFTIEITDYCPFACSFCSSDAKEDIGQASWLPLDRVRRLLKEGYDQGCAIVHISGGEPLFHADIGFILFDAGERFGFENVWLHTNLVRNVATNFHVAPTVQFHTFGTPQGYDQIHMVKRICQGRDKKPEVSFSRNFDEKCDCDHYVIRADGTRVKGPCRKEEPDDG
jgi:2-iminoacetate synthase ThiH